MTKVQLPKDALQRVRIGKAFAEYDIIRKDPDLFVKTPATLATLNTDHANCFFIGRRGAGKTALTYEIKRKNRRTIHITPQIFDLLELPLEYEEFVDTKQRPFKSLMHSMERALLDEVIKEWHKRGIFNFESQYEYTKRERGLIVDCDFDDRLLNLTEEIFEAYSKENQKLWLRQIKRSKSLISEVNDIAVDANFEFIILIDRLDESWDGSNSAIICLMALMHAAVRLTASTDCIKPYIFIRENIYDRIRKLDNEFSRLETSVVFLDWTTPKLVELIERRLIKPFNTKPKLGGEVWECFFENDEVHDSMSTVMNLCQHRPRDVVMLTSYAIDSAINHGNSKITKSDLYDASKRYSTSRLKDLGDEYAENYSNISLVLELFYGLGSEYTLRAIEDFIQKLLVNDVIGKHCSDWVYEYTQPHRFIELLYGIGFIGIKNRKSIEYKISSKDSNAKPAFDNNSIIVIHPTYREALNLRSILISDLKDETSLKAEGKLEDIPQSFVLDDYKMTLQDLKSNLDSIPLGTKGASDFEDIVGKIIELCFFRSLTNVQPHSRDVNGTTIRDWVTSNRATDGFWEVIRSQYRATQITWECKNYKELKSDDFHQITYYMNDNAGRFGVIVFRGDIKDSYYRHIERIATKHKGMVLLLTQKDLEVFLRQAIKGAYKEAHIQDRYDTFVRKIS
ncbi:transposase [Vibrio tubiashii]|uniref:P-loop ATPase, Sll1717 family n=1 Tax=Vibrio tubiashii TaxID=29498 RepID=UPI00234FA05E|nr:transposase [Vibrio tubiashii]WCP68131.1 transposase [Vibrio tubiashii]